MVINPGRSRLTCATASAPLPASRADIQLRAALPLVQNLCIRDVREGRAAVLLSAADATDERWGFLDNQGQLVIKPVFESIFKPFGKPLAEKVMGRSPVAVTIN